jgi:hypothetical protein
LALAKMGHGPVGLLPPSQEGNKFAVVAIEYITRWIEARPHETITSEIVRKFV